MIDNVKIFMKNVMERCAVLNVYAVLNYISLEHYAAAPRNYIDGYARFPRGFSRQSSGVFGTIRCVSVRLV